MLVAGIRLRASSKEQEGKTLQENSDIQMQEENTAHWYSLAEQSIIIIYLHIDSKSLFLRNIDHIQECLSETDYRGNG